VNAKIQFSRNENSAPCIYPVCADVQARKINKHVHRGDSVNHTRMLASAMAIAACAVIPFASSAEAQIVSTQRAGQGMPPGQVLVPSAPGGMILVGSDIFIGDAMKGLNHYIPQPSDTSNPDPVNTGTLVFDTNQGTSLPAGTCAGLCQIGQVIFDSNTNVYLSSYVSAVRGRPTGNAGGPGVWHFTTTPANPLLGVPARVVNGQQIAPNAGLSSNSPTAVALGPDGELYVGFLQNGNIVRISNPQALNAAPTQVVQNVGRSPNGRPVRALAFVGSDLYIASSDSLSVIKNATAATCTGGCNAVALADGLSGQDHVGLATDGINRVYEAVNGSGVVRYSIASNSTSVVSNSGLSPTTQEAVSYSFVAGHSNLLFLDRLGNLWVGDDTSGGATANAGRVWYISAAQLGTLPAAP
jgi:hypothetical protein